MRERKGSSPSVENFIESTDSLQTMAKDPKKEISYWDAKLAELEELVVSGRHEECFQQMEMIPPQRVPRDFAPRLAQLASRIQHSIYALKVMDPYVHPENRFSEPARDAEKMIYAYALSNLGAEEEALDLLEDVDSQKEPEALFQKAMAFVKQWRYVKSISVLQEFITASNGNPYRQLVGEVNLAAALICESRWDEVDPLLQKILKKCRENNYSLLLGNSLELQAQSYFFRKRYAEALACLDQSAQCLKEQKGIYLFFVEKWTALCAAFQAPTEENLQQLAKLRETAFSQGYWDTAREFDLFQAILEQDEEALRKVIMGTPSEAYRQRVRQFFGKSLRPAGDYRLYLGGAVPETKTIFNAYELSAQGSSLSEKPHLLALFEALTLDFYRPNYLGALFKKVYPQERFNPATSPARVLRLLIRLDRWFKSNGWPLSVHFKKSEFALKAHQPIVLVLKRGKQVSSSDIKWKTLRQTFSGRSFSAVKISKALGISKTSALRMLREALREGTICKVGQSRATEYRFAQRSARPKSAS